MRARVFGPFRTDSGLAEAPARSLAEGAPDGTLDSAQRSGGRRERGCRSGEVGASAKNAIHAVLRRGLMEARLASYAGKGLG